MLVDLDFSGLTGIVITPKSPDYDSARQEYNRAIQKFPVAIVYCLKIRDVSNAVLWARRNEVSLRIRAGGHNYEGYSTGNGVLVIDLSKLTEITFGRFPRTVTVQSGVKFRQLYEKLAEFGLPFPGGACPTVRVSGYALGGGWGYSARYLGLGCDSLKELKLVNYEGELLTVNERNNPDLYWACRGGGDGNYGVVVSLTFLLPPDLGKVTYFTFYRQGTDTDVQARFLATWQEWLPALNSRMTLRPSIYNSEEEGRAIFSRGLFYGRPEEARQLLKPLLESAGLKLQTQYTTLANAVAIIGASYPPFESFKTTGRFVNSEFSPCDIHRIVSLLDERPEGVELLEFGLFAMGGKVSSVPDRATAYFYRDAWYIIGMQAVWTDEQFAENGSQWVAQAFDTIAPLTEGSYVNFPYDELEDYEKAYYGGNVPRLRRVKRQYDPKNVFHYPQSIKLL
jgi:FAD/FMN-containing dehydrogenase